MMTTHAYIKPYSGRVRYYVQSSTNVQMRAAGPGRPRSGEKTDGWARVRLFTVECLVEQTPVKVAHNSFDHESIKRNLILPLPAPLSWPLCIGAFM